MQKTTPGMLITDAGSSPRDLLWRYFYWLAYRLLRGYWFLFRPKGRGTLVAIWFQERLLLIKNSYRRGYNLPGGARRSGEGTRAAAVREVAEEVGIRLFPNQLRRCGTVVSHREYLRDHCTYFEVHLEEIPPISIDKREVVGAVLAGPAEWAATPLSHQVATYLRRYYHSAPEGAPTQAEPG
jgi:8-oxo-dGTP diphosphatase